MPANLLPRLLICALVGTPLAMAGEAAPDATPSKAYSVLQRLGLLHSSGGSASSAVPVTPAPVPPAREPETVVQTQPAAVSAPAPADPLARAYEMLRAKGLLPGGAPVVPARAQGMRLPRPGAERVVVDKSDRKLFLLKNGRTYREYRISLGAMPSGPKLRAGDLRTPEGIYTLDWRNPHSRFYKSIHISYPNDDDRVRAQLAGVNPGGNVMIHGEHYLAALSRTLRRASTPKDWTEGCIALKNEQMDELWQEIADGTPIEIRP